MRRKDRNRRGVRWLCTLATALAGPSPVMAQPEALPAARLSDGRSSQAEPIRVTLKTADDDLVYGNLTALSVAEGAVLHTAAHTERRVPLRDLVRLSTETRVSRPDRRGFTFTLTHGDFVFGDITQADDLKPEENPESVSVDTADLGVIRIALDSITRIDTPRAASPAYRDSVGWLDRTAASGEDRILLTNGDLVRGLVTAVGPDGIKVDTAFGNTVVAERLVVAVRLASFEEPLPSESKSGPGTAPDRPKKSQPAVSDAAGVRELWRDRTRTEPKGPDDATYRFILTLRSTGRLTATELDWSGPVVRARLAAGPRTRIEADRIVRLEVVGGRWEWLSRHRPVRVVQTPMLSLGWGYAVDENVLGEAIHVAGKEVERGIGVHSRSSLTYELAGRYSAFVTSFGIDDDSGPLADVTVSILVDGVTRFERKHVRRGRLFGPIRLEVRGANRLELLVDFGDNGDIQDRFDWVEPALIR